MNMKRSAVSIVGGLDGTVLAVWNIRHGGWVLPGGKVEDGESARAAQVRELREETSLETKIAVQAYDAPSEVDPERHVFVYLVHAWGTPRENEPGAPVIWMSWKDLVEQSPFRAFYIKMTQALQVHV